MHYNPHPYQSWFIDRMAGRTAYAAMLPVGLGKTVIALTVADKLLHDQCVVSKVLVIAPLRVARETWAREAQKWDHTRHLRISVVLGTHAQRVRALELDADVYVVNRENVPWLVGQYPGTWPFDCVVIDELSSFKSHRSARHRALRCVLPRIKRIYGLTATPASNGLLDLWAQVYLLDRGQRLGSGITKYRDRWFSPDTIGRDGTVYRWKPRPGAEQEIYSAIADIASSAPDNLVKLPDRIEVTHLVDIPRREYDAMLAEYVVDDTLAANAAVAVNKLLQICNGSLYDNNGVPHRIHEVKLDKVEELIEAANGHNVLIFYQYEFDHDALKKRFGAVDLREKEAIGRWCDGVIPVAIAHPASAGHGLNLQSGGSIVIWLGLPWSLELYAQANGRLHRQGQQKTVFVHHILARGTVDESVLERLGGKDLTQQELLRRLIDGSRPL